MHLPDGFLDAKTAILATALGMGGLSFALRHTQRNLPVQKVPLLGLTAAFVFAVQMLNFPILAGTSGHVMGAVLVAVLLGPSAATVVMSAVLLMQCLLFADGGVTALGANIFNMGVVGSWVGYALYQSLGLLGEMILFRNRLLSWKLICVGTACVGSVFLSSVFCSAELAFSKTVDWALVFPLMTKFHLLIGLVEALITGLVLVSIFNSRPDLLPDWHRGEVSQVKLRSTGYLWIVQGLFISIGLAVFVAPLASGWPDGLEKTAEALGFQNDATQMINFKPSVSLPGWVGVLLIFLLVYGVLRWLVSVNE